MKFEYKLLPASYPTKTYRSKRTQKKMHLGEYQEFLCEILIPRPGTITRDEFCENEKIDDVFLESGIDLEIYSLCGQYLRVMITLPKLDKDLIEKYTKNVLYKLSEMYEEFAEIEKQITVVYGDAYYGEW